LPLATVLASALSWLPVPRASDVVLQNPARALVAGPDLHFPSGLPAGWTLSAPWSHAEPEWVGTPMVTCRSCRQPWRPAESSVVNEVQGGMRITTWIGSDVGVQVAPTSSAFELLETLETARVSVRSPDAERECVRAFGRFRCGPEDWIWVGASTVRIQERDETCIWMHPTSEGALVLRWDELPRRGILRGRAGVSDQAAATGRESTVDLSVVVDGTVALQESFGFVQGLQSWRVDIPAGEPTMQLALQVSAADTGMAHFCVVGSLVGEPGIAAEPLPSVRPAPARSERALRRAWGNRMRTFLFGEFSRANRPPRVRPQVPPTSQLRRDVPTPSGEGSANPERP
jgi:hypothetical protein